MEMDERMVDAAVIIAFLRGYNDDGFLSYIDPKVASTVHVLTNLFCATFPINSNDTANGIPGILLGRFKGDDYFGGNPWPLTTAGLATLYYRGA